MQASGSFTLASASLEGFEQGEGRREGGGTISSTVPQALCWGLKPHRLSSLSTVTEGQDGIPGPQRREQKPAGGGRVAMFPQLVKGELGLGPGLSDGASIQPGQGGRGRGHHVASGWRSQPLAFPLSGLWRPQSLFDAPFPQMHHGNESPTCRAGTRRADGSPGFGASWGALSCRLSDPLDDGSLGQILSQLQLKRS